MDSGLLRESVRTTISPVSCGELQPSPVAVAGMDEVHAAETLLHSFCLKG